MADVLNPVDPNLTVPTPESVNSGWETPPALQAVNDATAQQHIAENAPVVSTILAAQNPQATGEQRLKAADAIKAYSTPPNSTDLAGSHDIRWEKVLSAASIGDVITGFTGGSDVREMGRNGAGVPVMSVYNTRGDLRRYEWANGQQITPEELQKLGPIASVRDISAERSAQYKSQGLSAPVIAAAQAKSWGDTLNTASVASRISDSAIDNANQQKLLSQDLLGSSVNPATRALLAKVNTLTASKTQQMQIARDQLSKFIGGTQTGDDWNTAKDSLGGANVAGLVTYKQGEGLKVGNNKVTTTQDINDLANKIAGSNSSDTAITSNAKTLANEAQILAAGGKIQNLDKIQQLIGLKAQGKAFADQFELAGGIPGFVGSPNVSHATTDSFSLTGVNADYALAQAKAAKAFAEHVRSAQSANPYSAPDIGKVEADFAGGPVAKQLRADRTSNITGFLQANKSVMDKLNAAPAAAEIATQIQGAPVVPPTLPQEVANAVPGAKKPMTQKTAPVTNEKKTILKNIFGG